ncbi:MAG: bifunctional diaminohydroxyphosphoribosylaminopyrimidine deaminase/5-amino-6-(5-phosphoribosylamino)uracil reductase RibD [Deltaproteobacteria bacterium]|nr:bifunctional diaminohydroxyphosphoribosylaminopyrimidine deaminase/5-amino-6-(5-phosphoribosylamino)uracil reductase RibD [Deltaproteobacteria bacterium]MCB9478912.1 bifunctional diaminohydroxyphosphoribosylaminopyrimidine deaminase/5-amino-6-(5-phosphoribosylamino)uracil reductase RibD [Deltaproteobacteria bacterium]
MSFPDLDYEVLMRRALDLAARGTGYVHPNPLVGAILLKDGQIIGEGYHHEVGQAHAEINAIRAAKDAGHSPEGGLMVVTLEPCAHFGRTPPCVEALVAEKISHVVIGMIDPNPAVSGRGIGYLRENGIEVMERVLQDECAAINEAFIKYITKRTPYTAIKSAVTLDGKIATRAGKSQWISGPESLQFAHRLRHEYQAIMVGAGTVLADNPRLTCRWEGIDRPSHPLRVVLDGKLRLPEDAHVVSGQLPNQTIVVTAEDADAAKIARLEKPGVDVVRLPTVDGCLDFGEVMRHLGERKIASMIIEGGGTLIAAALEAGVVDRAYVVVAPKIFGSQDARSFVGGRGVDEVDDAWELDDVRVGTIGRDVLIEGRVRRGKKGPSA